MTGHLGGTGGRGRCALALATVLLAAGAAARAGAAGAPTAAPTVTDAESAAEKELAGLRDFLTGPNRTFETRRDAADALLEKQSDKARAILAGVLATPGEPALAVLAAVASRPSAPSEFIEPLFQLLKSEDEATRRAAAAAFGAYQGDDRVLAGLREQVMSADAPQPARLAAIQAMSQIIDARSIGTLVEATADAKPAVAAAAAEALGDMTGLTEFGTSSEQWITWWQQHAAESESRLLGGLLRRVRTELKRRDATLERVQARLIRLLNESYEAADAKAKGRLALAHLEDALPQVRALAAAQATALSREVLAGGNGTARQAYQELLTSLAKHLADEAPAVRAAAADALASWQEVSAAPALLARLDSETVPEARAAVAGALGTLKVVEAVPRLTKMLESASEIEVTKAAGALGAIGEKSAAGPTVVEAGLAMLGRLARTSPSPAVREAACRALAKVSAPAAEGVLVAALEDAAASVRFSAAQGLGNLAQVGEKTVAALVARLTDENKGTRQAVAAALGKLGDAAAGRRMAERLKQGAETEPAVRNALWAAIQALVARLESADAAVGLADLFFSREGAEDMQRAAELYGAALAKFPASGAGAQVLTLREKLVDAYVAAGLPQKAVPTLRQLLAQTPPENTARVTVIKQQLGLILLAVEPYTEGPPLLAEAMEKMDVAARTPLVKAIAARAEALLKADRPDQALELLRAFKQARDDWGGTDQTATLTQLRDQAALAAVNQAISKLGGSADQVTAATEVLKRVGRPAMLALLDGLEKAAQAKDAATEARLLAALETVTGRKDHGYSPAAPLESRLKAIVAWRKAV